MRHRIKQLIRSVTDSPEEGKKKNKALQFGVKVFFTVLAIYLVLSNLDIDELGKQFVRFPWWGLVPATLLHIASKVVSADRQNVFYHAIGATLKRGYNYRLYFVSMFYSLLLPGGISGDGYKVVHVIRLYPEISKRSVAAATLLDRIAGMSLLSVLAVIFGVVAIDLLPMWIKLSGGVLLIGTIFVLEHLVVRWIKKDLITILPKINLLSLGVQLLQVCEVLILLWLFGVTTHWSAYATLFLLGSVATIIPISIGGLGMRELVFSLGGSWLGLDTEVAVATASIFYLTTLLSAVPGMFLSWTRKF
ncbi:MAG: flippase-like domain-containing protein [Bacteroidota bacterium]|nr:flippase-like domain-containing protein [Bacteroidota bacterium]MDX5447035.1 flippase-like domain-containing protein [Bacteroidota bacterium]MDX5506103.1 flippase-like domain-containing protein [Bacteroidota bacterium]